MKLKQAKWSLNQVSYNCSISVGVYQSPSDDRVQNRDTVTGCVVAEKKESYIYCHNNKHVQ